MLKITVPFCWNKIRMIKACHPGGHYWCYYPGTLSLSQFTTTHSKIGHFKLKSMVAWSLDNSSRPSLVQIMACRPLVQITACRLFGAKPLSEPMPDYYPLDPWEHISVKFEWKCNNFHWRKSLWKCRLQNGGHLVSGLMLQRLNHLRGYLDSGPKNGYHVLAIGWIDVVIVI